MYLLSDMCVLACMSRFNEDGDDDLDERKQQKKKVTAKMKAKQDVIYKEAGNKGN